MNKSMDDLHIAKLLRDYGYYEKLYLFIILV